MESHEIKNEAAKLALLRPGCCIQKWAGGRTDIEVMSEVYEERLAKGWCPGVDAWTPGTEEVDGKYYNTSEERIAAATAEIAKGLARDYEPDFAGFLWSALAILDPQLYRETEVDDGPEWDEVVESWLDENGYS